MSLKKFFTTIFYGKILKNEKYDFKTFISDFIAM